MARRHGVSTKRRLRSDAVTQTTASARNAGQSPHPGERRPRFLTRESRGMCRIYRL
jgi:hypothetical protein